MELQRTSVKQKEEILELMSGSLEEFVQEERVAQWMRLCVGALKEFLDKAGKPLQRPLDHARTNDQPPPPRDHVRGDDHAPVTRGRMRTQYPLPHGP